MGNCLRNSFRFVCVFVLINSQTANYHLPNSIAIYTVKEKLCLFVREISFTVYFLF